MRIVAGTLNKTFPTNNLGKCTWYDGCGIERDVEIATTKQVVTIRRELDETV